MFWGVGGGGGEMKKLNSLYRKSRDRIKAVCSRKGGGGK
jgi:hypothetical protein